MTSEEWDGIKKVLKALNEMEREIWLEKVLLRNLILDSGWMPETELDAALARGNHIL